MALKTAILLVLLALLTGCANVVLHPIEKADIFSIEKGAVITTLQGEEIPVEKNGYFLSDEWLEQVAEAKVK